MTPPAGPPTIRRLLAVRCLHPGATGADVPAAIRWHVTTGTIPWLPLALAALGTLWFDHVARRARKENTP